MSKKIIVFDTNVLLDLYSIGKDYSESIIDFFDSCHYSLYISEFVYNEFITHYRRVRKSTGARNKIALFEKLYVEQHKIVEESLSKIENSNLYKGFTTCITDLTSKMLESMNDYNLKVKSEVENVKSKIDYDYESNDPVFNFVEKIKSANNFTVYTQDERIKMCMYAEQRIKLGIKPGLSDFKKDVSSKPYSKYNDVLIWLDLLSKSEGYDEVVFIENETKPDWWDEKPTKVAEDLLVDWSEKFGKTKTFNMYSLSQFLSMYSDTIDNNAFLQYTNLTEQLSNDMKNFTMCTDEDLEKIYNNLDFVDDLIIGKTAQAGFIEDVYDVEPIDNPDFDHSSASIEYDETVKMITVNTSLVMLFSAQVMETYDKESYPGFFNVDVKIIVKVELSYAVMFDDNVQYQLEDYRVDLKKSDALIIKVEDIHDYDESDYTEEDELFHNENERCPKCNELISEENYITNGFCVKCNTK